MAFRLVLEPFLDRILVRAREGSEDQFPSVRVPWMNRQVIALGDNVDNTLNVVEIDVWVDALCVVVQGEIDEVDVACTLPVSKEATFNAVCSSKNAKLSSGDTGPCVQG